MNKPRPRAQETQAIVERSLRRRYWAERRFRAYGLAAVVAGMAFLVYLFFVIFSNGLGAFRQTQVRLDVFYDPAIIDPAGTRRKRRPAGSRLPGADSRGAQGEVPASRRARRDPRAHAPGERQRRVRPAAARDRKPGADRHDRTAVVAGQRRRRPAAEGRRRSGRCPRTSGPSATSSSRIPTSCKARTLSASSSTRPSSPAAIRASRSGPASGARSSVRSSR